MVPNGHLEEVSKKDFLFNSDTLMSNDDDANYKNHLMDVFKTSAEHF